MSVNMNNEYTEEELDNIADLAARAKQALLLSEHHKEISEAHKENYQKLKKELNEAIRGLTSKIEKKVWNASELKPEHNGKIVTTEKEYTSNYGSLISKGEWTISIMDDNCYFESGSGNISKNITDRKDIEFTFVDEE